MNYVCLQNPASGFFSWTQWLKTCSGNALLCSALPPRKNSTTSVLSTPSPSLTAPLVRLTGYLDHYPFSKGISHWLNRHNSYSTFEAQQISRQPAQKAKAFSVVKAFISQRLPNPSLTIKKSCFIRLPGRPLIKFFILYFLKRGFLDGKPGFTYAVLQSIYEYMIILKVNELQTQQPEKI